MSADNGIYVGVFSDGEIRVIEAQAIDNIFYPNGENSESIVDYFQNGKRFSSLEEGILGAHKMEEEILKSDFPILEYGVNVLRFSKSLQNYKEENMKKKKRQYKKFPLYWIFL